MTKFDYIDKVVRENTKPDAVHPWDDGLRNELRALGISPTDKVMSALSVFIAVQVTTGVYIMNERDRDEEGASFGGPAPTTLRM